MKLPPGHAPIGPNIIARDHRTVQGHNGLTRMGLDSLESKCILSRLRVEGHESLGTDLLKSGLWSETELKGRTVVGTTTDDLARYRYRA